VRRGGYHALANCNFPIREPVNWVMILVGFSRKRTANCRKRVPRPAAAPYQTKTPAAFREQWVWLTLSEAESRDRRATMQKFKFARAVLAFAFATALPVASTANAAAYFFALSGANTATFTLDSSPTPNVTGAGYFTVQNVAGTYNGSPVTFAGISFFDALHDGGFSAGSINLGGPQLFTGTLEDPMFTLGTFSLCDCTFGVSNYTVSITGAAVPEAATWMMMLFGFGAIGLSRLNLQQSIRLTRRQRRA
jgi:PEP-CTERM motif